MNKIPLNPSWPKDKIIWSFTSNGVYTIKSGYKIGMNFIKRPCPNEGPSTLHQDTKLWKYIHHLPVQPKIKSFLWKAMLN